MRKNFFSLILGAAICGANSVFAMDAEELDIRSITPIKSDMNPEQWGKAIFSFLKESLKPESELKTAEISSKQSRQKQVGKPFEISTLNDGSEWIRGKEGGLNRFFGHLYLKKAIEHYDLKTLCVAETRFAYIGQPNSGFSIEIYPAGKDRLTDIPVVDSMDFCSYSRYVGDEGFNDLGSIAEGFNSAEITSQEKEELKILYTNIGYTDLHIGNLRKQNGKIFIIDTEYGSFYNKHKNLYNPYVFSCAEKENALSFSCEFSKKGSQR